MSARIVLGTVAVAFVHTPYCHPCGKAVDHGTETECEASWSADSSEVLVFVGVVAWWAVKRGLCFLVVRMSLSLILLCLLMRRRRRRRLLRR